MANQEWVIRRRPGSEELAEGHFELRPCSVPVLADGELLVRMELFSVDPTMRNFIAGGDVAMTAQRDVAYYKNSDAWQVGSPPVGAAVGRVVESRARAGPRVGALVRVRGPWRLFNAVRAPLAEELDDSIAPEDHLGVLGTGLAAYLPCVHIGGARETAAAAAASRRGQARGDRLCQRRRRRRRAGCGAGAAAAWLQRCRQRRVGCQSAATARPRCESLQLQEAADAGRAAAACTEGDRHLLRQRRRRGAGGQH
eukprot:TRINITY_DN8592_c0_g1_i1.p1 TRINITY_DN8592_c0_g1~~TRINITY_DN8592_c0_g1_i1.p1  ORF type:complete len:268 (+),score=42.18 TRINITY_DN8592_c0_g1_i1:45-806(+)